MHVTKAVITAAGRGARLYPATDTVQKAMLPIVDRDGLAKPAIQIIAEEALESGIHEVCVVCAPGDEAQYRQQFAALRDNLRSAYGGADWAEQQAERVDVLLRHLHFAVQESPLGYGQAVACTREFVAGEPFLLMLGDHLYLSTRAERCAAQLLALADQERCAVAAVQATREHLIGRYGTLAGLPEPNVPGSYRIERLIEKPSVSLAELELLTPGLRAGYYFCLLGMHVLTPGIFDCLDEVLENAGEEAQMTLALQELARRERYLALEVDGTRHDLSQKFGLLQAQLALALSGMDREAVLMALTEQLAEAHRTPTPREGVRS